MVSLAVPGGGGGACKYDRERDECARGTSLSGEAMLDGADGKVGALPHVGFHAFPIQEMNP